MLEEDIKNGSFDDEKSTIEASKATVTFPHDGTGTVDLTVTLFAESDPTQPLPNVEGVDIISTVGTVQPLGITDNVYTFRVSDVTDGGNVDFKFKTANVTSSKTAKVTFVKQEAPIEPEPPTKPEIPEEDAIFYVTFPERDGAVLYVPYHVLYEINKIQEENDGKWDEYEYFKDSKYLNYIAHISHIMDTYENALVLESRNGYYLTKEQLAKGHFYSSK